MPNNEIENQLKKSADKITVKSFSERRNNIADRILSDENKAVLAEIPVLETNENYNAHTYGNKKRNSLFAVLSLAVCCVLILAIVLPLTLRKPKEPGYYGPTDLVYVVSDEEQLFGELKKAGYEVVLNLESFTVSIVDMYVTIIGREIKGGMVDLSDEDNGFILSVSFYDEAFKQYDYFKDYELYYVNSIEIKYKTEYDGLYSIKAFAEYKHIVYEIDLLTVEENYTDIFDKLFS